VRKVLAVLGVMWVSVSLAAAWVAIDRGIPYRLDFLDQAGTMDHVRREWVYGWGTGLALPLAFLAAVAIMAVVCLFGGSTGRLGCISMAMLGAVALAYTVANGATQERLDAVEADRTVNGLIVANLVLSGLLVLVGVLSWLVTPRTEYR
jgi:hypothetical protein